MKKSYLTFLKIKFSSIPAILFLFFSCTQQQNNSGFPDTISKNYEEKYAAIFKAAENKAAVNETAAMLEKLNFLYKKTHFGNAALDSDSFVLRSLLKTIKDSAELEFYADVLKIKNQYPVLKTGSFQQKDEKNRHVLAYTSFSDKEELLTVLNMNEDNRSFAGNYPFAEMELLLCNYPDGGLPNLTTSLILRPFEARIYKVR